MKEKIETAKVWLETLTKLETPISFVSDSGVTYHTTVGDWAKRIIKILSEE